jgi:hypothetical protein
VKDEERRIILGKWAICLAALGSAVHSAISARKWAEFVGLQCGGFKMKFKAFPVL